MEQIHNVINTDQGCISWDYTYLIPFDVYKQSISSRQWLWWAQKTNQSKIQRYLCKHIDVLSIPRKDIKINYSNLLSTNVMY